MRLGSSQLFGLLEKYNSENRDSLRLPGTHVLEGSLWPGGKEKAGGREEKVWLPAPGTHQRTVNGAPTPASCRRVQCKLRLEEMSESQDQAHKPGLGICARPPPPRHTHTSFSLHTFSLFKSLCGLSWKSGISDLVVSTLRHYHLPKVTLLVSVTHS